MTVVTHVPIASPVPVPKIVRHDGDRVEAVQHMPLGSAYQDGHYPGNPIYPGVFLIESVVAAARVALAEPGAPRPRPLVLTRLDVARFVKPGVPGQDFTATLRLTAVRRDSWDIQAECSNEAGERLCQFTLTVGHGAGGTA